RALIQTTLWQHFVDAGRLLNHGPEPHQTVLGRVLPGPQLRAVVPLEDTTASTEPRAGEDIPSPPTTAQPPPTPSAPRNIFIPLGGGTHRKMMAAKYVPVLQRNRLEHFAVQNERWRAKARQKGLKIPDHAPEDAEE
ncbi:hypothetical protein HDZ31DRAFT_69714, partial [Schizophyllum fasciatum]